MIHPITTRSADCKDCYRCLRVCPVKAISVKEGQAKVQQEKCILCGKCVLECPQQAKLIKSEVFKVRDFLLTGAKVVLSIAPSFPAYFCDAEDWSSLTARLRKIGFGAVEETSFGAQYTAESYKELYLQDNREITLSSCCPVIVNIIEIYFPELLKNLAPTASPVIAHGLSIKERYGWDTKVVFAGPCIAKMVERGKEGRVDAVLTFAQLEDLLSSAEDGFINTDDNHEAYAIDTRLFPLPGGTIRSFVKENNINLEVETITGIEECWQTLQSLKSGSLHVKFIEMMACKGGCIDGPVMDHTKSILERKRYVLDFYTGLQNCTGQEIFPVTANLLVRKFVARPFVEEEVPQNEIEKILSQIGKYSVADEKNCGGCGYKTCREKAEAVFRGNAELEMCMSYMKSKAETTAHTIVNSTPNGVIVFDQNLMIKELNPAAKKYFAFYDLDIGEKLDIYMDVTHFLQVINTGIALKDYTVYYEELDLWTRQIIVPMLNSKENLYMAIITDITENEKKKIEMEQIKDQILSKAHHVINNQMLVAQQIAGLLGETTAETKTTLLEVIKHFTKETERKV
ncbi:MAG: [Fe-Fe] hydrogenase large subunit C-terminal domain-containing protein [Peptococcaceae bacterium]